MSVGGLGTWPRGGTFESVQAPTYTVHRSYPSARCYHYSCYKEAQRSQSLWHRGAGEQGAQQREQLRINVLRKEQA